MHQKCNYILFREHIKLIINYILNNVGGYCQPAVPTPSLPTMQSTQIVKYMKTFFSDTLYSPIVVQWVVVGSKVQANIGQAIFKSTTLNVSSAYKLFSQSSHICQRKHLAFWLVGCGQQIFNWPMLCFGYFILLCGLQAIIVYELYEVLVIKLVCNYCIPIQTIQVMDEKLPTT